MFKANKVINNLRTTVFLSNTNRTFKNFGHKRQPVPLFTFLWQGFLTFSFIGLGIEWKKIGRFIFGDSVENQELKDNDLQIPDALESKKNVIIS